MTTRIQLQPALVLHSRRYRDTSLLVDLLTAEHGRICAVARGARQARSRFKAVLRPFLPLQISWTGNGDLVTLTQAETTGTHFDLQGTSLVCGLYLNELLVRLLGRHDPCQSIYTYYEETLRALAVEPNQRALRLFELHLLDAIGYGIPWLEVAHSGEPVLADGMYHYRPGQGLMPVLDAVHHGVPLRGEDLLALAERRLDTLQRLTAAKVITRLAINALLGDRPLKSRELIAHIER